MRVNADALAVMARINKRHGAGTVMLGSTAKTYQKIRTGSLGLDIALGGGWAVNQWSEIRGEFSSGKTQLAFLTLATNMAADPNYTAVWIAAEAFVPSYAALWGVDTDRVLLVETNVMEDAYNATVEFAESNAVDAIVIDSLPALVPSSEDEKDVGESAMGRGALITGQFFRKVNKAMKRSLDGDGRPIVGLMINQYRIKIGTMYGDPRTTPGGEGKNFSYFGIVDVKRDEWREIGPSGARTRIGQTNRALVVKNKLGPGQATAYYDIYFDDGGPVPAGHLDHGKEIVSIALARDIITRAGAWYSYGEERWNGKDAVLDAARSDEKLAASLEIAVLDSLRLGAAA